MARVAGARRLTALRVAGDEVSEGKLRFLGSDEGARHVSPLRGSGMSLEVPVSWFECVPNFSEGRDEAKIAKHRGRGAGPSRG